jgi:predicted nucleic acid-binding protein
VSGPVVVDASMALKWIVMEPHTPEARALLARWTGEGRSVLAPSLISSEIANALYKRVRRAEFAVGEAVQFMSTFLLIGINFVADSAIAARALELAAQFGSKAVYDAHYLALAERETCELWTADEWLWNAVKDRLGWVQWIGNTQSQPQS